MVAHIEIAFFKQLTQKEMMRMTRERKIELIIRETEKIIRLIKKRK